MTVRHSARFRQGFTLTEMLIAITVIGILMGLLSMAVVPALRTAREATVILEMQQLELAIEQFNQKYGFYPPSFESGIRSSTGTAVGISTPAQLIPYIRKISPNHSELLATGIGSGSATDGSRTRLEHWWVEVGQYLDQESSLVFWLSGVCRNKQFPITGGVTMAAGTVPLAAHGLLEDGIEREDFFDFKLGQIVGNDSGELVYYPHPTTGVQTLIPASVSGAIYEYVQPHAGVDGDVFNSPGNLVVNVAADYRYKYRDWITYDIGGDNTAYYTGTTDGVPWPVPTSTATEYPFINPQGFQLISFGMDGLAGAPGNCYGINAFNGTVTLGGDDFYTPWGADNICSFTDGRLDKFVNNQ